MVYEGGDLKALGVEVFEPLPANQGVLASSTPAGAVAGTVHWGDYALLAEAHVAVQRWCAVGGHAITGLRWEVYGDWADDPAQHRTDVFYQLKQ
jgi:hypothetical protein